MSASLIESINKVNAILNFVKSKGYLVNKRLDSLGDGVSLFVSFCLLGCQASKEQIGKFKDSSSKDLRLLATHTAQLIVACKDWLLLFLCNYPDTINIGVDYCLNREVCTVRSGVQFMFDLFADFIIEPTPSASNSNNSNQSRQHGERALNSIFEYLKYQTIDDLDSSIDIAKKFNFFLRKEETPAHIPTFHHWWF